MAKYVYALSFIGVLSLQGCTSMPEIVGDQLSQPGKVTLVDDYRVGVDDVVQISVWRNPELSMNVPVRPDGRISLPLIGDVFVGGKTPVEIAREIKTKLSEYIREPNVSVILVELRSHEYLSRVRVTGSVVKQTSSPFRQGMTVLDVVLDAGGVNEYAAPSRTRLYRKSEGGETKVYSVDLDGILNDGDLSTNYTLMPGDIVTVPERRF